MNESIISPWIIYFIMQVDTFIKVSVGFACLGLFASVLITIAIRCEHGPETYNKHIKKFIALYCVPIVFAMFLTVCPSSKTIIAMLAADKVTYQTIQDVKDAGKDIHAIVKQDIIAVIEALADKEKSDGG